MALGVGYTEADITAQNLNVGSFSQFGTRSQPIRLNIRNRLTLIAGSGAFTYPYSRPASEFTQGDLTTIEGVNTLSGQQMIDVESLGDVDPAIFTEVRNYNHEDVAILLPPDQRLSDGNEDNCDDKNKKCKRQHEVN